MCQVCSPIRHVDIDRLKFLCSGRWWCIPLIFSSHNYITNYGKSSYMELKNKIKEFFFSWKKKPIVRIIEADRITAGPNNRDSPSAQPISLSLQAMNATNKLWIVVRSSYYFLSDFFPRDQLTNFARSRPVSSSFRSRMSRGNDWSSSHELLMDPHVPHLAMLHVYVCVFFYI